MLAGWLARSLAATHFFNVDVACANLAIFARESCQNLIRRPKWPAGGDGSASADARGRRPAGRRSRPRTARRAVGARCRGCSEGSFRGLDVPGWLAGSALGGWLRPWPALATRLSAADVSRRLPSNVERNARARSDAGRSARRAATSPGRGGRRFYGRRTRAGHVVRLSWRRPRPRDHNRFVELSRSDYGGCLSV